MTIFYSNNPAERVFNAEGVESFFRKIGGFEAEMAVHNLIYYGDFLEADSVSKLDGQKWWSLRRLVEWTVRNRPTTEAENAVNRLQAAEARYVSSPA